MFLQGFCLWPIMLALGNTLGPKMTSKICQMTPKMAPKTSQSSLPRPKGGPLDPHSGTYDPQGSPQGPKIARGPNTELFQNSLIFPKVVDGV